MRVYKIRDKDTGSFWTGYTISHYHPHVAIDHWSAEGGRVYRSISAARAAITNSYLNAATHSVNVSTRANIEIVEFKMVEEQVIEP